MCGSGAAPGARDPSELSPESEVSLESLLSLPDSAYPPGATPLRTLASSMPATAGVLRSQVDAAIEEWEGDPLMRLADALMAVVEPVLAEVTHLVGFFRPRVPNNSGTTAALGDANGTL